MTHKFSKHWRKNQNLIRKRAEAKVCPTCKKPFPASRKEPFCSRECELWVKDNG